MSSYYSATIILYNAILTNNNKIALNFASSFFYLIKKFNIVIIFIKN